MAGILDLVSSTPVGMGLSAAATVFGAIKGAKANKEQQRILDERQEENKADYDLSAKQSFLDTNAAKDAVKVQKEALVDNTKAVEGRAAITGASDEAKVAAQTGVQKNYTDAVSRLAGMGTQYQDSQKRMYLARKDNLDNQQMGLNAQKADSASNLIANAGDFMGTSTMTGGLIDGSGKKKAGDRSDNYAMNEIPSITLKRLPK